MSPRKYTVEQYVIHKEIAKVVKPFLRESGGFLGSETVPDLVIDAIIDRLTVLPGGPITMMIPHDTAAWLNDVKQEQKKDWICSQPGCGLMHSEH